MSQYVNLALGSRWGQVGAGQQFISSLIAFERSNPQQTQVWSGIDQIVNLGRTQLKRRLIAFWKCLGLIYRLWIAGPDQNTLIAGQPSIILNGPHLTNSTVRSRLE